MLSPPPYPSATSRTYRGSNSTKSQSQSPAPRSPKSMTLAISNVSGSLLVTRFGWTFHDLVWLNSSTTAVASVVIGYLPYALTARREGR